MTTRSIADRLARLSNPNQAPASRQTRTRGEAPAGNAPVKELKKTEIFLNIGILVAVPFADEDGHVDGDVFEFASLETEYPVDVEGLREPRNAGERAGDAWKIIAAGKALLYRKVIEDAAKLQPGESALIFSGEPENFKVAIQIRRVGEKAPADLSADQATAALAEDFLKAFAG